MVGAGCLNEGNGGVLMSAIAVVWVPDANLVAVGGEATSVDEQPDVTLGSLEDFIPENWGFPPYHL